VQSEFTWTPGYEFVEEGDKQKEIELIFFATDKSYKRFQKKIKVRILDAEDLDEKDKQLFIKYRPSLVMAKNLIEVLYENHVQLNKAEYFGILRPPISGMQSQRFREFHRWFLCPINQSMFPALE